jgi:hypothetical protein
VTNPSSHKFSKTKAALVSALRYKNKELSFKKLILILTVSWEIDTKGPVSKEGTKRT